MARRIFYSSADLGNLFIAAGLWLESALIFSWQGLRGLLRSRLYSPLIWQAHLSAIDI